jgi:hypothetical protein
LSVLTTAAWVIGEEQRLDIEDSKNTKNKIPRGVKSRNKKAPTEKIVNKPNKRFKDMTKEEYDAYMRSVGGVI